MLLNPRITRVVGLLLISVALAACPERGRRAVPGAAMRPTNVDEMVQQVLQSFRLYDFALLAALLPDEALLSEQCPARWEDPRGRMKGYQWIRDMVHNSREQFERCVERIDWERARVVERAGGGAWGPADAACPGIQRLQDIWVLVEVGDERFSVKLDDPFEADGVYGIADRPRCNREVTLPAPDEPAAETPTEPDEGSL